MASRIFRMWFYFRTGYGQYCIFFAAILNMLTTTYYLAIQNYPVLNIIFPSFTHFALIAIVVIIPLMLVVGYVHMHKSQAFSSEVEVYAESNPVLYKLPPGIQIECIAPLYAELLKGARAILTGEKLDIDDQKIKQLEDKLELLNKGESIPKPKDWKPWS